MSAKGATNYAAILADFVHDLTLERIGPTLVNRAVLAIRDSLACMLAGSRLPEVQGLHKLAPTTDARATVVGANFRTSPDFAALANGMAGISLELDEGNQYSLNHPTAHILPAALATAEELGSSGADLLVAYVAGYEAATRVGDATHLRDAVHPFGTHAIVGAAAASARLRRLDRKQIAEAMLMAAGMTTASSQTAANAGASVRNLITGLTAANGMLAARLTQVGVTAEPAAFEVIYGKIVGDAFDGSRIGARLFEDYFLARNYFKVHACSRWNHGPIEAAIAATGGRTLKPEEIAGVTVWTYYPATRLSWPTPANSFAAKHSIPYNVAVRLLKGDNGIAAYAQEVVMNPDVRALAQRIILKEDTTFTAQVPAVRPARIEIALTDGRKLSAQVDHPPGNFDNPFPDGVLDDKFRKLAGVVLSADKVARLDRAVLSLPMLAKLRELTELLAA